MKSPTLILLMIFHVFLHAVGARTWTSVDGKKIEAEFIETDGETVTIRRDDGRQFTLPLDKLSEADRNFVRKKAKSEEEANEEANPRITGEITLPKSGTEVSRDLRVTGTTDGAPRGYVVMPFLQSKQSEYPVPYGEYTRANRKFSMTVHHGDFLLGEWSIHLHAIPEKDAKKLVEWYEELITLYRKGKPDEVPPFDLKLLENAVEVASVSYFLRSK
ncbi:MAG: SHD1 domain-containing protein [Verrucomicrobiota bacterium]